MLSVRADMSSENSKIYDVREILPDEEQLLQVPENICQVSSDSKRVASKRVLRANE